MAPVFEFRAGDVLLYSGTRPTDWLVRAKSWSNASHCEISIAAGDHPHVVASKIPYGVNIYGFEPYQLRYVLRPLVPFNLLKAMQWFATVRGRPYGYWSLLGFYNADWQASNESAFHCSKLATEFLRSGGLEPFNGFASVGIAPGEFLKSNLFHTYDLKETA